MFELIPYILELDPETEIKLIKDLEPGKDGLPKMSKVLPTIVITSQSPFYIIISWLRWYIEFDFFPTYKSK